MQLNVRAFALALAALCGIGIILLGWCATFFDWGIPLVEAIGSFYIGYTATMVGALIGGVWAFFDGLIGGAAFAWLYNALVRKWK